MVLLVTWPLFKRLCGYANSQLLRVDTGDDPYTFKASFINPFSARPDKACFVMICPAHQVNYSAAQNLFAQVVAV